MRKVFAADSPDAALLAACIVLLDGVRPRDLPRVKEPLCKAYRWRELCCIEWRADEPLRLERRALSARTVMLLNQNVASTDDAPLDLTVALQAFLDRLESYAEVKREQRLPELERDLLCWWFQCLPMSLFFHLSGIQVLSAVSEACLAGADTSLVPDFPSATDDSGLDVGADAGRCAELLDAAEISEGQDATAVVLRQALEHLTMVADEIDVVAKRRWIGGLLSLRLPAMNAGPITSLLVAWAVDLVESGTPRQPNPPRSTPYTYLRKALLPIFDALRELPGSPDCWSVDVLSDTYQALIATQSPGTRGTMASALASFHHFLVTWFQVEPLSRPLHASVPLPEVDAIVVWPHQVDRARGWIPLVTDDPRLAENLEVMILIAREAACRFSELALLRLGNVCDWTTHIEFEVVRAWRRERLKTPASQRRLVVRDPDAMAVVRRVVEQCWQRRTGPKTLLFSQPTAPQVVYRRADTQRAFGRLMKSTTGCPDAGSHALRHTVISTAIEEVLMTSSTVDVNRNREVAVPAGHATGTTTLVTYSHRYEAALRRWLDAAVTRFVPVDGEAFASLTGLAAATLRQRAHRAGTDARTFGWRLLQESALRVPLPGAGSNVAWIEPRPPAKIRGSASGFGPAFTLLLLQHLAQGESSAEVAARFLLDVDDIERLLTVAGKVFEAVAARVWVRRALPGAIVDGSLVNRSELLRVDFGAAQHPKLLFLNSWLFQERPVELLRAAVDSWTTCRHGRYLGLDGPRRISGLYRLLAEAGVDPQVLRICVRVASNGTPPGDAKADAERDFIAAFGVKPRVRLLAPRERVPRAHLQMDHAGAVKGAHARGGSLAGLDALMLAVASHLAWQADQVGGR